MSREVQTFAALIPAGTPIAALAVTSMSLGPRQVDRVEVLIPPGPRGNVGFQLWVKGGQAVPYNRGGFVVADDEVLHWDLEGQPTSGAWELHGYNLGAYDHTLYVRFLLSLPPEPAATSGGLIDSGAISAPLPPGVTDSVLPPDSQSPPPIPDPAPLPPPPIDQPPPPPSPPPPPPVPGSGGGGTISDDMPAEVISETVVVTSAPYDVVLAFNPNLVGGFVLLRNPGAAHIDGQLVAVDAGSGQPVDSHDFHLDPGQGDAWQLDKMGRVVTVVLASSSGPVSVAVKTTTAHA